MTLHQAMLSKEAKSPQMINTPKNEYHTSILKGITMVITPDMISGFGARQRTSAYMNGYEHSVTWQYHW